MSQIQTKKLGVKPKAPTAEELVEDAGISVQNIDIPHVKTSDVLIYARDLMRKNWLSGSLSNDEAIECGTKFCAIGAIRRAEWELLGEAPGARYLNDIRYRESDATKVVCDALPKAYRSRSDEDNADNTEPRSWDIVEYNDSRANAASVTRLFNKAIKMAKAKEAE